MYSRRVNELSERAERNQLGTSPFGTQNPQHCPSHASQSSIEKQNNSQQNKNPAKTTTGTIEVREAGGEKKVAEADEL